MSLSGIVRAVRAHQGDLSRKRGRTTRPAVYHVAGHTFEGVRVHLPASSPAVYKAACTRLLNRLRAMYPEARDVSVWVE